jgi:DNA-directed RNA polymerase subunit E"
MAKTYKACKICKRLTTEDVCPVHGEERTKPDWFGFLIINDIHSEIARKADIKEPGIYAIKVRS